MGKLAMILVSLGISSAAYAVTLQPFIEPADPALPINPSQPAYTCAQIVAQLQAFQTMESEQEQSMLSFLNDVSNKVGGWYTTLSPLEGTTQTIATGTFSPLQDGANKVSQINGMANSNAQLLATQLNNIITSLQACTIQ